MKEKYLSQRDPDYAEYANFMAKELSKIPKRPSSTEQAESTRRILERPADKDKERQLQITDLTYWADISIKAKADHTVQREISPQEFITYKSMQRASKNFAGQSNKSITTDHQKEIARQTFMSTPGKKYEELTEEEKGQLVKLTKIEKPKEYEWKKLTAWEAFKHWLKGGKVRQDED